MIIFQPFLFNMFVLKFFALIFGYCFLKNHSTHVYINIQQFKFKFLHEYLFFIDWFILNKTEWASEQVNVVSKKEEKTGQKKFTHTHIW